MGERPWDPPRYEHKSGMIIPRYANIGGELWECVARNNSQVSKSGTFAPASYMLLRKKQHYQMMYKTDIKAENI